MEKYMKLYLRHINFKQPMESPTRMVLQIIKNVNQKLSVKMENDNIVILAEVKDMDYNKWEESTEKKKGEGLHFHLWSLQMFMRQQR